MISKGKFFVFIGIVAAILVLGISGCINLPEKQSRILTDPSIEQVLNREAQFYNNLTVEQRLVLQKYEDVNRTKYFYVLMRSGSVFYLGTLKGHITVSGIQLTPQQIEAESYSDEAEITVIKQRNIIKVFEDYPKEYRYVFWCDEDDKYRQLKAPGPLTLYVLNKPLSRELYYFTDMPLEMMR